MKYIYYLLFMASLTLCLGQDLVLEWQGEFGERPTNALNAFNTDSPFITEDFTGDGTNDVAYLISNEDKVIIVNNGRRQDRQELVVPGHYRYNEKSAFLILVSEVWEGTSHLLFCHQSADGPRAGVRTDDKVTIEDEWLTYPSSFLLVDLGDFDDDGQAELLFQDVDNRRLVLYGSL